MEDSPDREEVKDLSCGYVEVYESLSLGGGYCGQVYRAKCSQLPCVAKVFHQALSHCTTSALHQQLLTQRQEEECKQLSNIKHPHLVMYLGFVRNTPNRHLFLLMEAMDENLTHFLQRTEGPMPQEKQMKICHDIALGLSYLHSFNSLHRNLTSNNVLLLAGSIAKISDYGISSLANFNALQMPMSAYMPPEALLTPPRYSKKTDTFSYGVLIIQIFSKLPPNPSKFPPTPSKFPLNSSKFRESSSGKGLVHEIDRRKSDIDRVDPNHPLLPLAQYCLRNAESERPTANELCASLNTLMTNASCATNGFPQDKTSSKAEVAEKGDNASCTLEIFRDKLSQLLEELNDRDDQIEQRDNDIKEMDTLVRTRAEQMAVMEEELRLKDELIDTLRKLKTGTREKPAVQLPLSCSPTAECSHSNSREQGKVSRRTEAYNINLLHVIIKCNDTIPYITTFFVPW